MNVILVTILRHHSVHEINGHSSDVDYKSMLYSWFYSVKIFIFENHWLLPFVFQRRQLSDAGTYERGEPSTSGALVQGKFVNCCKNKSCIEKQIIETIVKALTTTIL